MHRLIRARAEDDAPQESMETLRWAYRSRLDRKLALHNEKSVNDHRTMTTMWGGSTTSITCLTITDLRQATLEWARQTPVKTVGQASRTAQIAHTFQLVAQTAPSTASQPPPPLPTDKTPMDIDAIVLAVMRAQEAAKKDDKRTISVGEKASSKGSVRSNPMLVVRRDISQGNALMYVEMRRR